MSDPQSNKTRAKPAKAMPGIMRKAFDDQKGKCWLCGLGMKGWGNSHLPLTATKDHVKPSGHGGYDKWSNYRLSHAICNNVRHRICPDLFRDTIGDAAFRAALGCANMTEAMQAFKRAMKNVEA